MQKTKESFRHDLDSARGITCTRDLPGSRIRQGVPTHLHFSGCEIITIQKESWMRRPIARVRLLVVYASDRMTFLGKLHSAYKYEQHALECPSPPRKKDTCLQ